MIVSGVELSTRDCFRKNFDVNVLGTVFLTEGVLPLLQTSGHARVVSISSSLTSFTLRSDAAWPYAAFQLPFYQASKAALNALTLSHATAFAEHGIKVNAVCLELTATEATQFQGRDVDERAKIAFRLANGPNRSDQGHVSLRRGVARMGNDLGHRGSTHDSIS